MSVSIAHVETLVFYDVPQVFLAADAVGTSYLCVLVEQSEKADRYASVAISPGRLSDLRAGRVDLLEVFSRPEIDLRYQVDVGQQPLSDLRLEPVERFPDAWLPEAGFFLEEHAPAETGSIVSEAAQRNRAVVHLTVSPPEARSDFKIDAYHLSAALGIFQTVVKFAYRKALNRLPPATRKLLGNTENYGLEVFAFSHGSFTVHMQSKISANPMGFADIAHALESLDAVTTALESPGDPLEIFREYKGHFATSYRRLLGFVVENETPLSYEWVTPEKSAPVRNRISVARASELYGLLTRSKELGSEEISLSGRFIRANTETGEWVLEGDDGQRYRGTVAEETNVDLEGIVLGNKTYKLVCEERIIGVIGMGRERSRLYLLRRPSE